MAKKSAPAKRSSGIRPHVKFILAEEVRQEIAGKYSLLGVFPAEQVIVNGERPAELPPQFAFVLPSLAFVFEVTDIDGKFDCSYRLLAPDERTVLYFSPSEKAVFKGRAPSIFGTSVKPFGGPEFGVYTAELVIGEFKERAPFWVSRGDYKDKSK